ncbi:unnamed protein product [Caenorhabditis angaria]|uniref:7TM GPCR serpentine receptor class x (Srx) domain-containing protein n=1 Tax=Caenorhabditis angaria TaxID=860376 RepID=A0A9P1IZZ5_9PELO|nr:unnamed protein product [Caenorhabditis angaria]
MFAIFICIYLNDNDVMEFMKKNYPKNIEIVKIPGIYIIANNTIIAVCCLSAVGVFIAIIILYISICYRIFDQVRSQQNKMSRIQKNHQRKVLIELSIQTIIKLLSVGIYAFWWAFLFVFRPNGNLNFFTLISHTTFVAAPIPGTLFMLFKHPTYFRRSKIKSITSTIMFMRSSVVHHQ